MTTEAKSADHQRRHCNLFHRGSFHISRAPREQTGKTGKCFGQPWRRAGNGRLGAGAASLEIIELGPQHERVGWVQFMLRRETFRSLARCVSSEVAALTLLNPPHTLPQ